MRTLQENQSLNLEYLRNKKEREMQQEIERLKEMKLHTEKYASEMEDKYILEKSKNDKAIEYINKHTNNGMFGLRSDTNEIEELLYILKGVNKE